MRSFAGIDVHKKNYQNTLATADKEHLDVVHLAFSQDIPDRTAFLQFLPNEILARAFIKIVSPDKLRI